MKKNQALQILSYLKSGKTITTMQAMKKFGCCRLAARIADIKAGGHEIGAYWSKERSGRVYKYYLA